MKQANDIKEQLEEMEKEFHNKNEQDASTKENEAISEEKPPHINSPEFLRQT